MQGTTTYWNEPKGFGFIDSDERGISGIFIHISNIADKKILMRAGMRVEFETVPNETPKHPLKAINVVVLPVELTPAEHARQLLTKANEILGGVRHE